MAALDLIYPKYCFGCRKKGVYLCTSCMKDLKKIAQICPECRRPSTIGMTHPGCRKSETLEGLYSIWPYRGVVRKAILALKYKFAREVAKELSLMAGKYLRGNKVFFGKNAILIPIPIDKKRGRWRGFNQVEEIGKLLSREMNWDYQPNLLIRKKSARPQTELGMRERFSNIKGAFSLKDKVGFPKARFIVIFDDVWTTGATLKEAAKVLKREGIKKVWGLTIAR